jgi:hypothetical protein
VILDLLPANEIVQCDYLGNPLRGLPLTAKATLHKGTQEITAAMELAEAARKEIIYYPGGLVDPLLGDFYPTLGYPVVWSLINAPAGVTIDNYGLITASATAQLNDINEITVRAAYHGKTYDSMFGITKARGGVPGTPGKDGEDGENGDIGPQGSPAPHYRGVTLAADTGNTGTVTLKLGGVVAANAGDWVAYVGATVDDWQNGYCMRWNGSSWDAIPIETVNGNFETHPYMLAMMDLTENAPRGTFINVLTRDLIAKTAMIENLQTRVISITGDGAIKSANFSGFDSASNYEGFGMRASDGLAVFNRIKIRNAEIRGDIYANLGYTDYAGLSSLMRGAVRGIVTFRWSAPDNSVQISRKTANIDRIDRLGVGKYVLWTPDVTMAMLGAPVGYYSTASVTAADLDDSTVLYRFSSAIGVIASEPDRATQNKNGLYSLPFSCMRLDNGAFQDINGHNSSATATLIILG